MDDDMRRAVATVDACAPGLPVEVLASFADAVFNLGPKIACDSRNSSAARLLHSGQYRLACQQLPRWDKAKVGGFTVALPGLTSRRASEMALCLSGAAK